MVRLANLSLSSLAFAALVSAVFIVPGGPWRDTNGNLVNAHAGGVTFDEATKKYWLFGEYKVKGQTEGGGVRVHSSEDLATWEDHGLALAPIIGHPRIDPSMVIQRPKVVYAESTGKYNMWWHADAPNRAYNWLLQGHAVSDTIEGPYTYVDAFQPLGNWSQDFGLFTDPHTKTSYALYSNGDRREARDVYPTSYNEDLDTTRWFSGFKIQLEIESAIMNYISNF
ncbi:glycosyl hydrolase [Ilyonectria robusta]|uniref:glycosyl hydrolase n=1 Tax=Ilyonectria robusta TaxID=1079257 RepID=UPI001E8D5087|nr:glycosyl hydrolase [Ilyonectria robusta]KAH8663875.1 glycosyl hydrolase [Ilyonectria robusta]